MAVVSRGRVFADQHPARRGREIEVLEAPRGANHVLVRSNRGRRTWITRERLTNQSRFVPINTNNR